MRRPRRRVRVPALVPEEPARRRHSNGEKLDRELNWLAQDALPPKLRRLSHETINTFSASSIAGLYQRCLHQLGSPEAAVAATVARIKELEGNESRAFGPTGLYETGVLSSHHAAGATIQRYGRR